MTWRGHFAVTAGIVFAATGRMDAAAVAGIGSLMPDKIEGPGNFLPGTVEFERWAKNHRTWSHWFPPYVVLAVLAFAMSERSHKTFQELLNIVLAGDIDGAGFWLMGWGMVGALFHIAEDALTGIVPGLSPWSRRNDLITFKNGSLGEAIAVLLSIGAAAIRLV